MPPLLLVLHTIHRANLHESLPLFKCCLLLGAAKKLVMLTKMVVVCNSLRRQFGSSLLALRSIFKATHLCKRKLLCSSIYEMLALTCICNRPITVGLQSGWGEIISEEHSQIFWLLPSIHMSQEDRSCGFGVVFSPGVVTNSFGNWD